MLLVLPVFLVFAQGCDKQSSDTSLINKPVVEAYLIPGQVLTVKLYKQKLVTDTAKYGAAITGLQVYVSDGNKKVLLTETRSGVYIYSDLSFLIAGKTYSLQFTYLSYAVSAQTVMPAQPTNFAMNDTSVYISTNISSPNSTIDTVDRLTWANPAALNHIIVFDNLSGNGLKLTSYRGTPSSFEVNTDNKASYFATNNTFGYYGIYNIILLRVNQEYIDYIKSNTNSATSQTLTDTYTNITNGYGIFTAMQAASDTLHLVVHPS
ncbi:MAG: DUF4249 family protein [Mucilaginibacter sp.]